MAKPCDEYSGICARLAELERQSERTNESLDVLKKTMNRWGGIFVGIAALPVIMKVFELLSENAANAAIGAP